MTTNGKKAHAAKAPKTPPALDLTSSADVQESPTESSGSDPSSSTPPRSSKRKPSGLSLAMLLNRIRTGQISGKSLHDTDRLDVVEQLVIDGHSTAEIAFILGLSVRTIERIRDKIREKNKLRRDPDLSDRLLGQLKVEADINIQKLWRMASDKGVDARVKVMAIDRAFAIRAKSVELIHNLGHIGAPLPDAAAELPSFDELEAEFERLAKIGPADESDKSDLAEIKVLHKNAKLAAKAVQMKRKAAQRDAHNAA